MLKFTHRKRAARHEYFADRLSLYLYKLCTSNKFQSVSRISSSACFLLSRAQTFLSVLMRAVVHVLNLLVFEGDTLAHKHGATISIIDHPIHRSCLDATSTMCTVQMQTCRHFPRKMNETLIQSLGRVHSSKLHCHGTERVQHIIL